VKGSLSNIKDPIPTIYFAYRYDGNNLIDSAKVTNGAYTFKLETELPALITLLTVDPNGEIRPGKKDIARVYLQNGINSVSSKDSFSNVSVKESKAHAEYAKLNDATMPVQKEVQDLIANYNVLAKKKDSVGIEKLMKDYDGLQEKLSEIYGDYVKKNSNSPIALYALGLFAGNDIDVEKVEPLYNSLSATTRSSAAGERFSKKIGDSEGNIGRSYGSAFLTGRYNW